MLEVVLSYPLRLGSTSTRGAGRLAADTCNQRLLGPDRSRGHGLYVDPIDVPTGRNAFLSEGEVVVVRSGAYTADSAIIPKMYSGAVTGYDMVVTVTGALPEFVAVATLAAYVRYDQLVVASLRAAQPHLNAEELGSTYVSLPPLPQQTAIARFLDAADHRIFPAPRDGRATDRPPP